MGYTTTFQGALKFTKELTMPELRHLQRVLGKDARSGLPADAVKFIDKAWLLDYIDLKVAPGYDGVCWNGQEKSYRMEYQVAFVLAYMRATYPDFGLSGYMDAQGEDIDDRWQLVIQDGQPVVVQKSPKGRKVRCPHCETEFYIDDERT